MKFFGDRGQRRFFPVVLFLSFLVLTGCAAREDKPASDGNGQDAAQATEAGTEQTMGAGAGSGEAGGGSDGPVTQKTFSLDFRTKINQKKMTAAVKWKKAEGASKYVMTCSVQKKGDWEKIEEKTIPADQETVYRHKISVGKSYRYEVNVYQNVDGKEYYLLKPGVDNACYIDCNAPDIVWEGSGWYVDPAEGQREYVRLGFSVSNNYFAPTGFEIYRGLPGDEMELVDTIGAAEQTKKKPFVYEDDTVQSQTPYSYRIRSYVEVHGKRIYGKKSDGREVSTEISWGSCKAELIVPETKKIEGLEVVVTSQEDKVIKWGKKYNGENMLSFFTGARMGETDSSLGLDDISYKLSKTEEYKTLAPGDTVLINPKSKLFIRFARKDHAEFKNPVAADGGPEAKNEKNAKNVCDNVCIDMFFFKGHHSFLHITDFAEGTGHIKWREDSGRTE